MNKLQYLIIGLFFFSTTAALEAQLQQSPWPMFHRNPQHTGLSSRVGPETPALKWSYNIGSTIMSSPAIASDGTIYIGTESGALFAITRDGALKWSYQISSGSFPYIRGVPAIDSDGTVYIGQWDTKKAYAFHPDGTLKWSSDATGAISFCGPAIGSDGTVYVLGCGLTRGLSAIDPADGSINWRVTTGSSPSAWNEGSPAIGHDGRIYFGSGDCHIYCVDASGAVAWTCPTAGQITRGPAVGPDGTVYAGSGDAVDLTFYAVYPDGTLKWTFAGGNRFWSSPAIGSDGTIYVGCDDRNLYAIEDCTTHGSLKWTFTTGSFVTSAPAIGADGTIYVGSHDSKMYAVNPNGTLKWQYTTGGIINSSPAIGSDGTVYFGSRDGFLYAIGPGPTSLAADSSSISASAGGTVNFTLTAGTDNANRNYLLCGSSSGTDPGTLLPGGLAVIPLNRDWLTDFIIGHLHYPQFTDFWGTLNASGGGAARLDVGGLLPAWVGTTMHFAFATASPWDFASNPVEIEIVP